MIRSQLFCVLLTVITLSSCGDCIKGAGEVQPETRSLATFDEVSLDTYVDVKFRQIKSGEVNKVVVTAQENLLPYIKTTVAGGEFVLSIDECLESDEEIRVELYGKSLRSLTNNGSGDFKLDGKLTSDKLNIQSNASGEIELNMDVNDLELEVNGSGDVALKGASDYMEVESNGSGSVMAIDLRTFDSEITLNGSGDAQVYAKENLELEVNGSGDVYVRGKAKQDVTLNGTGIVKPHK